MLERKQPLHHFQPLQANMHADGVFLQGMRVLVDARDKLGISWQSCENEKQGMLVMSWEGRVGVSGVEPSEFQLYVMALSALWQDTGIQEAYTRRSEFQLVSTLTHNMQLFFHCTFYCC